MSSVTVFSFLRQRAFLLLLLLVFVLLKLPHLSYPFYWDECWPYATAINRMYLHGPSLVPGAIDPVYYRGHPMLFFFLASAWMRLFGPSHIAMHSFSLFVSVLLIITVYEAGLRLFSRNAAMLASLLVAFQVAFFVHASFLLPEILLALLAFLSIVSYVQRRYLMTGLLLTALFYTKESGVIPGIVLGIDALLVWLRKKEERKAALYALISVSVPFLLGALFFIAQKAIVGWYVFPFHTGLIDKSPGNFCRKFAGCLSYVFRDGFRYILFALPLLLMPLIDRKAGYITVSLAILCLLGFTLIPPDRVKLNLVILAIFSGALAYTAWRVWGIGSFTPKQRKLILLLFLFSVAFFAFTSTNFFIVRYLFLALIPMLFLLGLVLSVQLQALRQPVLIPLLALIALTEGFAYHKDDAWGDVNPGAFDGMKVQQKLVGYLEQHRYYDKVIGANAYLARMQLTDPHTGYLSTGRVFSRTHWEIVPETEVSLFTNIEPDYQYERVQSDPSFKRVYRVTSGKVWGEIYVRIK